MKYNLFVSGVQEELKIERRAVKNLIIENPLLKDYFNVFLFEDLPAKGKSSKKTYTDEVHKSNVYIGIFGNKYGNIGDDMISATEREFREAQKGNKEILIFIKENNDKIRDAHVRKLITEIRGPEKGYIYKRFNDLQELKNVVYEGLIAFLREKGIIGRDAFDQRICSKVKLSHIDEKKIRWFLRVSREKRNFPLSLTASVKDVLTHLNLLREGGLTNAAILLFGRDPHKFFLQAEVKCIQFPGTEVEKPFMSYHIYDGNLFEQVDLAVSFVLGAIRLPVIQQEHTAQAKRPHEIPAFAVQEAIVNAVAHRDYETTAGVQVMVFLDRVEIWNSGSLPPNLKISDLKQPHASYPNNPLIASTLYLANYIQRAGSGTLEMVKQCKAQGLPEPDFVSIRNDEFRVILPRDVFTKEALTKIGLNERQIKAVKYVKEKGRITNREYRQLNNISDEGARRDLDILLKKKIFKNQGGGRSLSYII